MRKGAPAKAAPVAPRATEEAAPAAKLEDLSPAVRRMIESSLPHVAVLAYNEIVPEVAVEAVALVGMNG